VSVEPPHPRTVRDLVGHTEARARITTAWQAGRMPHALLISGARGIGKATFAYWIARGLLTHGDASPADDGPSLFGDPLPAAPKDLSVDPNDPIARRVDAGSHGDLIVAEAPAGGELKVDDIRALLSPLRLTAQSGGWRVVLIDGADRMNRNAQNALLKTLEEPRNRVAVLMIAESGGRLLPTIRSRCRRVPLSPLTDAQVRSIAEGWLSEPSALMEIAIAASEGSPGRAAELMDGEAVEAIGGLFAAASDGTGADAFKFAGAYAKADAAGRFSALLTLFRWWLGRALGQVARGQGAGAAPHQLPGDADVAAAVAGGPSQPWLALWDEVGSTMSQVSGLAMDRQQALLHLTDQLRHLMRQQRAV